MTVRFLTTYRQFNRGDEYDGLDDGVATALIDRRIAVRVEAKSIDYPPRDKMIRRQKVATK